MPLDTLDPVPWFKSKTVIASIITVIAVIAGYFGYDIAGADQASLVENITSAVAVIGSLLAAVFRIFATQKVGKP